MKKLGMLLVLTVVMLSACGENEPVVENEANAPAENATSNNEENTPAENTTSNSGDSTYDLTSGEELYLGNCAGCHGANLSGGAAPPIVGLSFDYVRTAIEEGPGGMPANLVTGEEADNVAAWVAAQE